MTNKKERTMAAKRLDDRQGQNPLKKMKLNPTAPLTKRNKKVHFGAGFSYYSFCFYDILTKHKKSYFFVKSNLK